MKKILITITIIIALITVAAAAYILTQTEKKPEPVTLNYWGVFEPPENLDELIKEYQSANPHVTINYTRKGLKEYKQQIVARAGKENGPDIFRYHNSWTPSLATLLAITPAETQQQLDFEKTFYPVVKTDLAANRGYYGIPLMYDGLGLYYNKQLFRDRGLLKPPQTWKEIIDTAKQLKAQGDGKLEIAGIAMGSTENIDYWSDILSLLLYQNNVPLNAPAKSTSELETTLKFYKEFITEHKVWDKNQLNSTDAFAQGKLAMMFGVSWSAFEIQSKNPNLEFAVAPVPQIPGTKVGIASYWVEGVANNIPKNKQTESWKFLTFMASKESQQRLYAIQGKTRLFGAPPSRVDMASEIEQNQYIGGIIETAPVAGSTYINDKTFGGGFNNELSDIYKEIINTNNTAKSKDIDLLYKKYDLR